MKGKDLADFRMNLGQSQEQFAENLRLTRGYISQVEAKREMEIPKQLLFKVRKKYPELPNGTQTAKHLIPYIDIDVTGSGIEVFYENFKPTFFMDLPGFRDCNFSINVFGNAMHPTFDSGTIILCKELTDKGQIIYGEVFFIVTEENRLLRRVLKSTHKGYIIIHCDNPDGEGSTKGRRYADQELIISSIIKIYLVKGSIRRHQI